jgi:hypothetical protein
MSAYHSKPIQRTGRCAACGVPLGPTRDAKFCYPCSADRILAEFAQRFNRATAAARVRP